VVVFFLLLCKRIVGDGTSFPGLSPWVDFDKSQLGSTGPEVLSHRAAGRTHSQGLWGWPDGYLLPCTPGL
jgi:hypothetical protein